MIIRYTVNAAIILNVELFSVFTARMQAAAPSISPVSVYFLSNSIFSLKNAIKKSIIRYASSTHMKICTSVNTVSNPIPCPFLSVLIFCRYKTGKYPFKLTCPRAPKREIFSGNQFDIMRLYGYDTRHVNDIAVMRPDKSAVFIKNFMYIIQSHGSAQIFPRIGIRKFTDDMDDTIFFVFGNICD